jgi:phosphate transport system permease protein
MTSGLILAVMITPIITALSREALATVAQEDKNAALGMGATRWEMLRATVFPRVRGGIVGAVMLGLGRAMGETIAVALTIGSSAQITTHLFSGRRQGIANTWRPGAPRRFIGLGVVLFVITILVNVMARAAQRPVGVKPGRPCCEHRRPLRGSSNRTSRRVAASATVSRTPGCWVRSWSRSCRSSSSSATSCSRA